MTGGTCFETEAREREPRGSATSMLSQKSDDLARVRGQRGPGGRSKTFSDLETSTAKAS